MRSSRIVTFFIYALVFGLALTPEALARGVSEEDRLPEATRLIEEQKYNEAQLILADIIRKEPERFDEVEEYLQLIRKANVEYNRLYVELIDILNPAEGQEIDRDAAYAKIQEMEELNKSPNEEMTQAFAEMRESIVFAIENQKYEAIMEEAGNLLNQEEYWDAASVYVSGFRLHNDQFRSREYGNIAETQVDDLIAGAEETVGDMLDLEDSFRRYVDAFRGSLASEDIPALEEDLANLSNVLLRVYSLQEALRRITDDLTAQRSGLLREDESDIPYISTVVKLTSGREGMSEGIETCLGRIWDGYAGEPFDGIQSAVQTAFQEGVTAAREGMTGEANDRFETAARLGGLVARSAGILGVELTPEPEKALPAGTVDILERALAAIMDADAAAVAVPGYEQVRSFASRSQEIAGQGSFAETLADLGTTRNEIISLGEEEEDMTGRWREHRDHWQVYADREVEATTPLALAGDILDRLAELSEQAVDIEITIVHKTDQIRFVPLVSRLEELSATVSGAKELIAGISRTIEAGEESQEVTARYPGDAREILEQAIADLGALDRETGDEISRLESEKIYLLNAPAIQADLTEAKALAGKIETVTGEAGEQVEVALQQIRDAERYRQEGERRLQEAQDLTGRNEFALARKKLEDAADRFSESLLRQEDPEVRALWDTRIAELQEEIGEAEKRIIVQEVRDYINRGKALYSQGEFTEAEGLFLSAQKRWSTVSVDSMSEVEYWLALTQTALSVNSGREVEGQNPLFTEITSVLNLARRDYERGKQLMAQGAREEALSALDEAEKKLLYVQTLFPFNQEASVLSLRILQVRDQENFLQTFGERFTGARNKIRRNPQEAYVELKDLEAINPDYPGMARAIYDAEIAAGIRLPPPDTAALEKSSSLYRQAFEIVSNNVRSQFPIAITYLDQALELNSDNLEAARLKDRIYIDAGSTATTILSSADQQEYRRAEELFISGEYYVALAVIDRLLQNPENKRNLKVIELKRRIESRI